MGNGKKGDGAGKKGKGGKNRAAAAEASEPAPTTADSATQWASPGTSSSTEPFPQGACGLDSRANVWLKHAKPTGNVQAWAEGAKLADGSDAPCRTYVGPKRCPMADVPWRDGADHIALMPLPWLVERGCEQRWGKEVNLETPDGQQLTLGAWHRMPYLTADQVAIVMAALPPPQSRGRSGKPAGDRVAAAGVVQGPRACAARTPQPTQSAAEPPSTQHCPGEGQEGKLGRACLAPGPLS